MPIGHRADESMILVDAGFRLESLPVPDGWARYAVTRGTDVHPVLSWGLRIDNDAAGIARQQGQIDRHEMSFLVEASDRAQNATRLHDHADLKRNRCELPDLEIWLEQAPRNDEFCVVCTRLV